MDITLRFFASTLISLFFSFEVNAQELSLIEKDTEAWKQLVVCDCVMRGLELPDSIRRIDGTISGVLMTNRTYGMDDFEETKVFVKNYLDDISKTVRSMHGNRLIFMKCMMLHNSKELDDFLTELRKD
jgi:hypothetical protein